MFGKTLGRLKTCLSLNSKVYEASVLLVPIMFHDNLKFTPVTIFVVDFNLLSWDFDKFIFTL